MKASSIEQILILIASPVLAMLLSSWFTSVPLGQLILILSVVFLLQTLLRDLWLLYKARRDSRTGSVDQERVATLFCLESTVGICAVVLGLALYLGNIGGLVTTGLLFWFTAILLTLFVCFWMRDYVIQWQPWRIFKDPDHANIIPVWRNRS